MIDLFRAELQCTKEKKDEEAGIWFEVLDDSDADLYDGVAFRAEKVSMYNIQ